jgi:exoribonuclease-2
MKSSFDLNALARRAMQEAGFETDIPSAAFAELQKVSQRQLASSSDSHVRDLRSLLWSSIDNRESRDLDQVEFAEKQPDGGIKLMIGIADVDAYVPADSAIDHYAAHNSTSVYTGVETFSMLPEQLSTDLTSLLQDADHLCVVVELLVHRDGTVVMTEACRAIVRNHARLVYESVGAWLEGHGPLPEEVAHTPGLEDQLHLQNEAAERLQEQRLRCGALDFETIEAHPVVTDGKVVDLTVSAKNRARYLIETFMVSANTAIATFLEEKGWASIQRVVRTPERWSRIVEIAARLGEQLPPEPDALSLADFLARRKAADPVHFPDLSLSVVKLLGPGEYVLERAGHATGPQEGHFGLAVHNYTHSTAPNRRYADLIIQRLLKAAITKVPTPYGEPQLDAIAHHCTEREDAARKVERRMRKSAAAALFSQRIGEVYDAIVTGVSAKGTYVRVLTPPVEGRVMSGERGLDVGDAVRVRLTEADPDRGFIDFAALGPGR